MSQSLGHLLGGLRHCWEREGAACGLAALAGGCLLRSPPIPALVDEAESQPPPVTRRPCFTWGSSRSGQLLPSRPGCPSSSVAWGWAHGDGIGPETDHGSFTPCACLCAPPGVPDDALWELCHQWQLPPPSQRSPVLQALPSSQRKLCAHPVLGRQGRCPCHRQQRSFVLGSGLPWPGLPLCGGCLTPAEVFLEAGSMGGSGWTAGGWQQAALTWCAGSHSLQLATSCCLGVEVTGKFLLIVPGRQLRRPGRVAGPQRQCVHLHGKDPATACWPQTRRATCCVPSIRGRSLLPAPGAGV